MIEANSKRGTYATTSCARLAASGSLFFAMLPEPPRPVVYTSLLSVGVSSDGGCRSEGVLPMFPAPPRPCERARCSAEVRRGCSGRGVGKAAMSISFGGVDGWIWWRALLRNVGFGDLGLRDALRHF